MFSEKGIILWLWLSYNNGLTLNYNTLIYLKNI